MLMNKLPIKKNEQAAKAYEAQIQKAMVADKDDFPQLSTELKDNQAQVLLKTSKGDITIKLFPKFAPLAVENFFDSCKKKVTITISPSTELFLTL